MSLDDIEFRLLNSFEYKDHKVKDFFLAVEPELRRIAKMINDEHHLVLLQYADKSHLERWESSLQVDQFPIGIEERRRYLQTLLVTKLRIGADSLSTMIKQFTGADNKVEYKDAIINISLLEGISKSLMERFESLMREVTPAHLYYKIDMHYMDMASVIKLGSAMSGALELEVTDQYDSTATFQASTFSASGSIVQVQMVEFTDQYESSIYTSGSAFYGASFEHVELSGVTDQYETKVDILGSANQASVMDYLEVIQIE